MPPQVLSKIAIRIVAIYMIAQGIIQLSGSIVTQLAFNSIQKIDGSLFIAIIFTMLPLLSGLLIWFFSNALSKWVAGEAPTSEEKEALNITNIQAVALSTIGLVLIFTTVPTLLTSLLQIFSADRVFEGKRIYDAGQVGFVIGTFLEVLLGILLVVGANFWSRVLYHFRQFGLK